MTDEQPKAVQSHTNSGRRRKWPWIVLLLAIVGGVAWWLWDPSQPTATIVDPIAKPKPAASGYVGSQVCAECHREISERYAAHPMANSLAAVKRAAVVEDYEEKTEFTPGARHRYRVERNDDEVLHVEVGLDRNGEQVFEQKVPIHYAIGSGRRGRSYILEREGYLFMSPISWYSQAGKWDLSPDYKPEQHPRFEREATDRCLQCHAGRLDYAGTPTSNALQHYRKPAFLEEMIGCERCHGPAQAHVARHRQQLTAGDDPIVNPVKLDAARRDAVCNQCHLQGERQILRYGRTHGDFRPGDHLGSVWSVFVDPQPPSGHTTAVSQVEQMQSSKCFTASQGKLGCVSCHDPHSLPSAEERVEFYRQRCAQCHDLDTGCKLPLADRQNRAEQNSCIDCHMPALGAADVPHTTQTDHRVLRDPQGTTDADVASSLGLRIFDEDVHSLPDIEMKRARGLLFMRIAETEQDGELARKAQQLLGMVLQAAPEDIDTLDGLALAALFQGDNESAVKYWERILEIDPKRLDALLSLATYFHNEGHTPRARLYIQKYVEAMPWRAEMQARYSHVLWESNQLDEALVAANRSLELDPSVARIYEWLAQLYAQKGNLPASTRFGHLGARME